MSERKKRNPSVKIGDRFGKLVVIEKVRIPVKPKDKSSNPPKQQSKIGWKCKCDCGEEIVLSQDTLKATRSTLRSCDKCPPEANPDYTPDKMTFEEKQEWDELYNYVRKNILEYDNTQNLSKDTVLKLKGLLHGKYYASNKSANNAEYTYTTILNTFKYCSPDIYRILRTYSFNDEQHKVNYVFKIIEKNINNVYLRMKSVEKAKEDAINAAMNEDSYFDKDAYFDYVVENYQRKTEDLNNDLLKDLW